MRLIEPNEEEYALWINKEEFYTFCLLYTELGYKTISDQPLRQFSTHYECFIINKKDKDIGFMELIVFSKYQDKEYFLTDLIKSEKLIDCDNRWIPCSEELPSIDGDYEVTVDTAVDGEKINVTEFQYFRGDCEKWKSYVNSRFERNVIAWKHNTDPYEPINS